MLELKMSMKKGTDQQAKHLPDTFSATDYRVAAIEKWFEAEVARIHRKVELLTEVSSQTVLSLSSSPSLSSSSSSSSSSPLSYKAVTLSCLLLSSPALPVFSYRHTG
jgi:hypothetical protein